MINVGGYSGAGKDPLETEFEHADCGRPITIDELRNDRSEMKTSSVQIHAPVGPWHSPQEIRAWIEKLETRRADDAEDHATDAVDAALEQARGWLGYAEKRWAMGRKPSR